LLPSLSSLVDEDVAHRREMFLELADRVDTAARELAALDVRADPSGVVAFLAAFAERRGFELPAPALLAIDARAIAEEIPADLLTLACRRLWAQFRYRRLPEPPDFAQAIREELDARQDAAARIRRFALKVETARMRERLDAAARERHARGKAAERAREREDACRQADRLRNDAACSAAGDGIQVDGEIRRIQDHAAAGQGAGHRAGYNVMRGTDPMVKHVLADDEQDVLNTGTAQAVCHPSLLQKSG
jgi:hypothetical protein